MTLALPVGLATAIGSLPHTDAGEAARFSLRLQPRLPAAPSLPGRSVAEGMIAQAAAGIRGITIGDDGVIRLVRGGAALDPAAPVHDSVSDGDAFAGLRAFLDLVAGRREPVKLQITGPVTLGLALVRAGAAPALAFEVAGAAVQERARQLLGAARARLPDAPLVVFLDEPSLVSLGAADFPLAPDCAVDLVSSALAALETAATTGLHCCGPTDWPLLFQAGPQIVSLPADAALVSGADLSAFLERGGWVAWGAVPTDGPVGTSADRLWRSLSARWCELVQGGCDPVRLRTQALLTPACGLAHHGVSQAEHALRLANQLAERLHDQAVGVRLSVGA